MGMREELELEEEKKKHTRKQANAFPTTYISLPPPLFFYFTL